MTIIRLKTDDGLNVEYVDEIIAQGGMKDVYFSPDRSYVVAFFRDKLDFQGEERLKSIVDLYRKGIFENEGGDYWKSVFCWPTGIVRSGDKLGITAPVYNDNFFFTHGSVKNDFLGIRGKEKEGKWFASASNRSKYLPSSEKGNWLSHLQICLTLSRSVRRLHAAGLAHSDLSYKNVLVDPITGSACVIDIDGLVVPNKYPPDVVGTPDFIAPEVVETQQLSKSDPTKKLPSNLTDRHALAVLIYMYLLYRHPLRGQKIHDQDSTVDEELTMGAKALFIEDSNDSSNRVNSGQLSASQNPWGDPDKIPYTVCGPLLADLFRRAFETGLHKPQSRPTPSEWENALVRTIDMIQPCSANCEMGWYIFDNTTSPSCPFCFTTYQGKLPVLNFYSSRHSNSYQSDNHRLMVWDGQSLFPWHSNRKIFPNEHLSDDMKKRIGYFQLHQGDWYLVNEKITEMYDVINDIKIPIGGNVKLEEGSQLLLSRQDGGRLVQVQLVN